VNSYEIGTKNSFFGRHLQVNLSGFRMDYQNQQVTQYVTGATSSGSQTVNAGRSRIWGAELNLIAMSDTLGKLTLSTNYTHARYLQFISSAGWEPTVNLNLAGNRLPLAPTWSVSGQYELPIELSGGGTITPRVAVKAQTAQYFGATNFPDQRQGGYALFDLGLDYAPASGAWSIQAFVRNVGDRKVLANADEFYLFNNYSVYYQPPRTYGARLIVNFR
jgi:iron complex outermembrane receptor protein